MKNGWGEENKYPGTISTPAFNNPEYDSKWLGNGEYWFCGDSFFKNVRLIICQC